MTGFGTAETKSPYKIQVSIKSVNGRYLETRFHSGREYADLEVQLKKKLAGQLGRGSIDVYIHSPKAAHITKSVSVDFQLVKKREDEFWIRPKIFSDPVFLKPGDWYKQGLVNKTNRKLSDLGVYNFIPIQIWCAKFIGVLKAQMR